MRNVKEAMAVADENQTNVQNNQKLEKLQVAKKKLRNWLYGIMISIVPLMAVPFSIFVRDGNIRNMFYNLFCDISIMFVGVSFTIVALNDFIAICTERNEDGWIWGNLILLLLGAIFYTVVVIEKNANQDINIDVVFWMDFFYFLIMLGLSASKYVREIKEVR